MERKVRVLTVYPAFRSSANRSLPRINLEGVWLMEAGFAEGDKVAVRIEPKKLTITIDDFFTYSERAHRGVLNINREDLNEGDIVVQYKDSRGLWRKEMINTVKEGDFYKVINIPYRAPGIALGDLVEAEEDRGVLFFIRVAQTSGNRVIHLEILERYVEEQLYQDLKATGCTWIRRYRRCITINIPLSAPWERLIQMFDWGAKYRYWVYQQTVF